MDVTFISLRVSVPVLSEQITDTDGWQTLKLKHELGVPLAQCLVEAGYSPAQAEAWAAECISLPCFPEMTAAEIELVAHALAGVTV